MRISILQKTRTQLHLLGSMYKVNFPEVYCLQKAELSKYLPMKSPVENNANLNLTVIKTETI